MLSGCAGRVPARAGVSRQLCWFPADSAGGRRVHDRRRGWPGEDRWLSDLRGGSPAWVGTIRPARKRPFSVQFRGTQVATESLRRLKACRLHLALGEVATRDLGLAGNRVEEVRM